MLSLMSARSPRLIHPWKLEVMGTAIAVLVGAWARTVRYFIDPISLWLDEASWGVVLMDKPLLHEPVRPLGFFGLTQLLAKLFGPYEQVLRLLPWLCGIASLPMAYLCARLLFQQRLSRVIVVWLFALHPLLIDYSKEFKPYSVEVFCHLLVTATTLRAVRLSPLSKAAWAWALLTPLLVLPFAYNVLWAYPGIFGVLLWHSYRNHNRRQLAWAASATLAGLGLALVLQFAILSRVKDKRYLSGYWGHRYDVFLTANRRWEGGVQPETATRWVLGKYAELAGSPGFAPSGWHEPRPSTTARELQELYRLGWQLAVIAGAVVLLRRHRPAFIVLLGPLAVVGVLNALGKWPLGFFRVNLFTLAYSTLLGGAAIDRLAALSLPATWSSRWRFAQAGPWLVLGGVCLLPRLSFSAPAVTVKETRLWMGHSEIEKAVKLLIERGSTTHRLPLFADFYSYNSLRFYERWHPRYGQQGLNQRYRIRMTASVREVAAAVGKTRGAAWILISRHDYVADARKKLSKACAKLEETDLGRHHLLARCENR